MILVLILCFIFLVGSIKYPDQMFWIALMIFIDPGGYVEIYVSRNYLSGIQISDLQFFIVNDSIIFAKN